MPPNETTQHPVSTWLLTHNGLFAILWLTKSKFLSLNAFLKFSEYEILTNAGSISHEVALALASKEYEKYRVIQDKKYVSDFDKEIKRIMGKKDER